MTRGFFVGLICLMLWLAYDSAAQNNRPLTKEYAEWEMFGGGKSGVPSGGAYVAYALPKETQ